MTLEEAIEHAKDIAKDVSECTDCRMEHKQLTGWLEELLTYRKIGTPEECREAMEKKKRKLVKNPYGTSYIWKAGYCPVCGCGVTARWDYCQCCGQKLNWENE